MERQVQLDGPAEVDRTCGTVEGVGEDYLLDNISNTLEVAAADSSVAKRLFIFLGIPGCLLAAMLAAYAGSVLAAAQRREQATLPCWATSPESVD